MGKKMPVPYRSAWPNMLGDQRGGHHWRRGSHQIAAGPHAPRGGPQLPGEDNLGRGHGWEAALPGGRGGRPHGLNPGPGNVVWPLASSSSRIKWAKITRGTEKTNGALCENSWGVSHRTKHRQESCGGARNFFFRPVLGHIKPSTYDL